MGMRSPSPTLPICIPSLKVGRRLVVSRWEVLVVVVVGDPRPHLTEREKQKTYTKGNAPATNRRDQKVVPQDEGSHVAEHREKDLIVAPGGTEGEASEFSED
ncbi:hypothetical protein Scep_023988 [Stephania cephalantha]|uniref:Uncharacterized protein n=1 Tax=Stephania cephalantha TaxID=152367 RepID=A0AAP0HTA3_9MAGN